MEARLSDNLAPIRVLHVVGGLDAGGIQTLLISLLRAVDRERFQFDFLLDHREDDALVPAVRALGAQVYYVPRFRGWNISQVLRAWDAFFTAHPGYDILHSHVRSYASLYLPLAKRHGLVTVIHSHNTSNGAGLQAAVKGLLQYPLRWEADCFLACSRRAGEWLFGKKVTAGDKFHLLRNGVDLAAYRFDPAQREAVRRALGLGSGRVFIHVGRLIPQKNHRFLLEAFRAIRDRMPDSTLLLAGDGALAGEIRQQIRALGLEDAVLMLGARDDVPRLLQGADCLLFPSLWEGEPYALIEAQAAGLPCIVSDRIVSDVPETALVRRLPVDRGPACWAELAAHMDYSRLDVTDRLREAGYDIAASARWLSGLYTELLRTRRERGTAPSQRENT